MWDGLFLLLVLSSIMAVASFAAGSLPLSLRLSQRQLRLITAIGTGVLVGTALIVIIPEGIETLYSATSPRLHARAEMQRPQKAIDAPIRVARALALATRHSSTAEQLEAIDAHLHLLSRGAEAADAKPNPPPAVTKPPDEDEDEGDASPPKTASQAHPSPPEPHAYIGLALVLGFTLMYLVDVLPRTPLALSRRPTARPLYISLSNLHAGAHSAPDASPGLLPTDARGPTAVAPASSPPTTTLGLVLHAIADGIALGASTVSASTTQSLSLVVFLALMLHKAPAAFGLTAVLLKQGLSTRAARAHLIVFSLAAPAGALATWVGVHVLGSATGPSAGRVDEAAAAAAAGFDAATWWTGLVLVFSGGTFLYVAMHSMRDAASGVHGHDANGHGHGGHGARFHHARSASELLDGGGGRSSSGSGLRNPYAASAAADLYGLRGSGGGGKADEAGSGLSEVVGVVFGMLVPLVAQAGHSH